MHFRILIVTLVCICVYRECLGGDSLVLRRVVREPKLLKYLFGKLWNRPDIRLYSDSSASASSTGGGNTESEAHSHSATFALGPFSATFATSRARSKSD
ncbi:hypothetical protein FQR65_LT10026 [Abscondita terminalis]|nr:hypothetical protein FQR65_LT10026 [Abscondita terminalis]